MIAYSAVDSMAGQPYLVSMLKTPVQSDFLSLTSHQAKMTPARYAAQQKAIAARKQKAFETGERIFEKLKWRCNTQEFGRMLRDKSSGLRFLNRLEQLGFVVCVEKGVGTKPAKWIWKGK